MPNSLSRLGLALRGRYLDVLASVYIYNEHRGYTSLDRVLQAVRRCCPDEPGFIAEIVRHREDERKHYLMFQRWFERQGRMPLAVDKSCGHIDRFIAKTFGCTIDELETEMVVASDVRLKMLCRVIMLTEQRGFAQLNILLKNRWVRSDPVLTRIFKIIHKDEPGHFLPYQHWLERHGRALVRWQDRATDFWIHHALLFAKLPSLFCNRKLARLQRWPDADDL